MNNIMVIGTPLYQWETGRKIQIIPLPNMHVDAVHFSNFGDAEALVVIPREENGKIIADIPNILLQSGGNLVVYTVNVSQDSVETLVDCTISVRNRAKPADYVYTETEVFTITNAVERALEEAKESGEFNGKDGKDGVVDYSIVANALKGEKYNVSYVSVDDFSPFDHELLFKNAGGYFKENGKSYMAVFSKNFIDYKECYKDFFSTPTEKIFSAAAKDIPAIKIPVPDELANHPLRFSAKIKNSEEECCLRVYVYHADGTKQGGAKSTCSTTSFADSFIDFTAQKGDVLYLNYSKYGDSIVYVQDMMLTLQDLKDCEYEDYYFKKYFVKNLGYETKVKLSEFDSRSLVFFTPLGTSTHTRLTCCYNRDINKVIAALEAKL